MAGSDDSRLRRDIGLSGSAFLSFNGIVGAGIFALPAALHLQFGAFSPWLFPIFGLLILLVALPIARLASLFPQTGGPVAYAAAFGPAAAFQVGWLYYLARTTAFAANATVFATYAAVLWAPFAGAIGRAALLVALVATVTWINMVGVRRAIRALDAVTLLKAVPLVGLAVWGLAASGAAIPSPGPLPPLSKFEAAALMVFYAFVGFENCVVPAGETRSPQRTIPRALVATLAATALLYFLVQLAYAAVMPAGPAPEAPLAALAERLVGPVGLVLLALTAMASVGGNFLGSITSTPRVTFALAEQRLLPGWFGAVSPRWSTPANSILFMGLLGGVLALTGSFVWLAVASTLARMIVYAASIAALPSALRGAGLRMGAGTVTMMTGGLLVCLWSAYQSRAESWMALAGLVAVGLLLYAVARRQAGSAVTISPRRPSS